LDSRLPNNISVTFPQNITGEALLYMLDISDIKVSTGSACNSKSVEPSYVLKALGLSDEEAMRTIRISLSDDVTYEQIDYVIEEVDKAIKLIKT
jgi:cysteine desulfurase